MVVVPSGRELGGWYRAYAHRASHANTSPKPLQRRNDYRLAMASATTLESWQKAIIAAVTSLRDNIPAGWPEDLESWEKLLTSTLLPSLGCIAAGYILYVLLISLLVVCRKPSVLVPQDQYHAWVRIFLRVWRPRCAPHLGLLGCCFCCRMCITCTDNPCKSCVPPASEEPPPEEAKAAELAAHMLLGPKDARSDEPSRAHARPGGEPPRAHARPGGEPKQAAQAESPPRPDSARWSRPDSSRGIFSWAVHSSVPSRADYGLEQLKDDPSYAQSTARRLGPNDLLTSAATSPVEQALRPPEQLRSRAPTASLLKQSGGGGGGGWFSWRPPWGERRVTHAKQQQDEGEVTQQQDEQRFFARVGEHRFELMHDIETGAITPGRPTLSPSFSPSRTAYTPESNWQVPWARSPIKSPSSSPFIIRGIPNFEQPIL